MKIIFSGDFYPSNKIIDKYLSGEPIFDKQIIDFFKKADYSFVNLEAPILPKSHNFKKNLKLAENLFLPESSIKILKELNISHACLANNHIMDYGISGLNNTINGLVSNNIEYLGTSTINNQRLKNTILLKNNNNKVAIFNSAEGEEGSLKFNKSGVIENDNFQIFDDLKRFKEEGYFVVMIVHAGVEHIEAPPPHIIDLYRKYCKFGCDIVIGHHPHVPQGYEDYLNSKIYYSLGNFVMGKKNWKNNASFGQIITLDVNSNKAETNLNYINIGEEYISFLSRNKQNKINKIILQKFKHRQIIWDNYVKDKYNPIKLMFPIDLLFLNFSRSILRLFNILNTPSHQYGIHRWIVLNKDVIIRDKQSRKLDFLILLKKIFHKIKNLLF